VATSRRKPEGSRSRDALDRGLPSALTPARIRLRVTGERTSGGLLGLRLFGHLDSEIAKRIDVAATAISRGMTADASKARSTSKRRSRMRPFHGRRPLTEGRRASAVSGCRSYRLMPSRRSSTVAALFMLPFSPDTIGAAAASVYARSPQRATVIALHN
jgi:hypothetical protein